jgi:hypothetical protein
MNASADNEPIDDERLAEFWCNVDASRDIVIIVLKDDGSLVGTFSKLRKAEEAADKIGGGCTIIPQWIDRPDWGDGPRN